VYLSASVHGDRLQCWCGQPKQAFTLSQVPPVVAPEQCWFPIKAQAPNGTANVQGAALSALEFMDCRLCLDTRFEVAGCLGVNPVHLISPRCAPACYAIDGSATRQF